MELARALADDILAVLPFGGPYLSVYDIINRVSPPREKEVRAVIRELVKKGHLDMSRGGNGRPAYYGRKPLTRRI
jgi:hypothetical protein